MTREQYLEKMIDRIKMAKFYHPNRSYELSGVNLSDAVVRFIALELNRYIRETFSASVNFVAMVTKSWKYWDRDLEEDVDVTVYVERQSTPQAVHAKIQVLNEPPGTVRLKIKRYWSGEFVEREVIGYVMKTASGKVCLEAMQGLCPK